MYTVALVSCVLATAAATGPAAHGRIALRGHGRHVRGRAHATHTMTDGSVLASTMEAGASEDNPVYDRSGYDEDWTAEWKPGPSVMHKTTAIHEEPTKAATSTDAQSPVAESVAGAAGDSATVKPAANGLVNSQDQYVQWKELTSFQWKQVIITMCVQFVFILLVALIYDRYRHDKPFPQHGHRARHTDSFTHGLFACFGDCKLCIFSSCCTVIRWSDTVDKAGLVNYWCGIVTLLAIYLASPFLFGLGSVAILCLLVHNRQKLRAHFGMKHGDCGSCVEDLLTYCCCACCAIIQEAREVEMDT